MVKDQRLSVIRLAPLTTVSQAYHTFPRKAYKRMHGAMLASTWATEDAGSEATPKRKLTYSDVAFKGGGIS